MIERRTERHAAKLQVHAGIEEQIFYPAYREASGTKKGEDLTLEAYEEHRVADRLISELRALPNTDETWGAKLKVLKENLEHHIKEEETELFPKVKKAQAEGKDLGEAGDEYKQGDKALSEGMQEEAVEHFKKAKAAMPKE